MKRNSELRAEARQALEGNWGDAALVTLVALIISGICSSAFQYGGSVVNVYVGQGTSLIGTLITLPITFALTVAFLRVKRGGTIGVKDLFAYYNGRVFITMVLKTFCTILWSLLLFIPGIIKAYSYAMTEYIMIDNPELSGHRAIEASMQMMEGKKMKLFLLDLSFIGWIILTILTCGLGAVLLEPYIDTAHAAFYEDLKAQQE